MQKIIRRTNSFYYKNVGIFIKNRKNDKAIFECLDSVSGKSNKIEETLSNCTCAGNKIKISTLAEDSETNASIENL